MTSRASTYSAALWGSSRLSSHWAMMTLMGVRSSWEASEVNCCSVWKAWSSRSNIWFKAPGQPVDLVVALAHLDAELQIAAPGGFGPPTRRAAGWAGASGGR